MELGSAGLGIWPDCQGLVTALPRRSENRYSPPARRHKPRPAAALPSGRTARARAASPARTCSRNSSQRPSAAVMAMTSIRRVRWSRPGRAQIVPHANRVISSWNSRVKSVADAMLRSTCASPSAARRIGIPVSTAAVRLRQQEVEQRRRERSRPLEVRDVRRRQADGLRARDRRAPARGRGRPTASTRPDRR